MTVKAIINYFGTEAKEDDRIGVILSMDLSAAFDTVNHATLEEKLEYYCFRNRELNLMKSYLKERFAYVQINNSKKDQSYLMYCFHSTLTKSTEFTK